MSKIRINELARELEVKPSRILDVLPELGVADKKTHSSSLDDDLANDIRKKFGFAPVESIPDAFEPAETETQDEESPRVMAVGSVVETEPADVKQAAGYSRPAETEKTEKPAAAGVTEARVIQPLRPPLSSGRPLVPPVLGGAPSIPIPGRQPLPPQAPAASPSPGTAPVAPASPAPSPTAPPPQQAEPGAPVARVSPLRPPVPQQTPPPTPQRPQAPQPPPPQNVPRPGQILSGPRQPIPHLVADKPRSAAPGQPTPPPPRPPVPARPSPPTSVVAPGPSGSHAASQRAGLAGQPAPRPVVPPRPDMVARLTQSQPKPAMPGQPAPPRPGAPRSGAPLPGQPIYRGPIRPGQPLMRGPGIPSPGGGPPGLRRGRGMHPTTPLAPEPATVPTETRRHPVKSGRPTPRDREIEEGKLRPISGKPREAEVVAVNKEITIGEGITVKELSEKLGIRANLVIKKLVDKKKVFATINQTLDLRLAEEIAASFGAATSHMSFEEEATQEVELAEDTKDVVKRAPVVTVMGHVDHGKTSLLDAIRVTNVAEREAGGITQHIGAYQIHHQGRKIVFIDTPGHEAFTRMRARGAKVTDIVVLVVAADDGVMPQTLEAIDHARAAGVPIIVAINKIDKPDAQTERIKQQLTDRGLMPEDWGGDTVMVPVSARTKQNIELLLEMIILVADLQDLKANPSRPGVCTILEAKLDRGRGPVATILVRNGTLRVGDFFICGTVFGKVRALIDDLGQNVREAESSTPVEVLGLESLPEVGETLQVVTDTAKAKQIVVYREAKARELSLAKSNRVSLETLHEQLREGEVKELNIILKADVGGSAEVLGEALQKLSSDKVRIRVLHTGVGAITETDVLLASASDAIVIGFNVRPERNAAQVAEQEKVDVRLHTIIYDLTQEIKKAMAGMLDPVFKEIYKGRAEVREVFRISKVGMVAGCIVQDGILQRNCEVRVLRDNVVIHTGKIEGLRRFKDDVSEVRNGLECGVSLANFKDLKPSDILEAFITERVATEALV